MRNKRLVGVALREPIQNWGGKNKSPCLCSGIAKYYAQHQSYPMVIEIYEKSGDSNTRS